MKKISILLTLSFLPIISFGQLEKLRWNKVGEGELVAVAWINPDSILSHDKVLIMPISALSDEIGGITCLVKTDSTFGLAAIVCALPDGKIYREITKKEKYYISPRKNHFAFNIKGDDVFYWSK